MSDAVTELAEQGFALDARDRRRLVELLVTSLADCPDPDVEEAWRVEIRRRVAIYRSGSAVLHEVEDVMAEAKLLAP